MDDVIKLIPTTQAKDSAGVIRTTEGSPREVLCHVRSVSRNEFFKAGRSGLNPAFVFVVFHGEYQGETLVEYRGQRYAVYRTYQVPDSGSGLQQSGMRSQYDYGADYMELYAQRKGGTNAQNGWD